MKRHSILHIVGDSKYGGGSVIIENLAVAAKEHGYKVSVLTSDPVFIERLENDEIDVVNLDCISRRIRLIHDISGLIRLKKFLSLSDFDIVHTHTSKAGFVGRVAARWAKVPIIIHTVHGFVFHEASTVVALKFYSTLERIAAKYCDALVTVSWFHYNWAQRLRIGNSVQRVAIPNGIDSTRVKQSRPKDAVRAELAINHNQIMCLTIGRLATQKGLDILLRALAEVQSVHQIHTVIAGEGPERQELEKLCSNLQIQEFVSFVGFRKDLGNLLHAADIVVLPSRREGLSISLLEAMAAGKAIITTDIGSNMEVTRCGQVAQIVKVGNIEELTVALEQMADDESERKLFGERAFTEYEKNYTEEIMVNKYMKLYNRMVRQKLTAK